MANGIWYNSIAFIFIITILSFFSLFLFIIFKQKDKEIIQPTSLEENSYIFRVMIIA